MKRRDKPLVWLQGEIKTPPFTQNQRLSAGFYLRRLQTGRSLSLPISRPMPSIGARVHELRIASWRIIYRVDQDAIVIAKVLRKTTQRTPKKVSEACRRRLTQYDSVA